MATGDLTTLANVKMMLSIATVDTSADAKLNFLITSQSAFFLQQINRPLLLASYTETLDGHSDRIRTRAAYSPYAFSFAGGLGARGGGYALTLRYTPVVVFTSLTIDGTVIPQGSGANTSAQVDGWTLNGDRIELLGSTYFFTPGIGNVVVAYTAGYATVPPDVEQAVIELVRYRYGEGDRVGLKSKSMGNGEATYYQTDAIPPSVQSAIDQYTRIKI